MAKKENTSSNPKTTNQTSKIGDAVNLSLPDFKYTPKPPKKDSEGK
jgi:hypothetical protein|tara:strand:+ start:600 stop:737 length:138 start_codon:yes stop_codon:yes gene_type:complete